MRHQRDVEDNEEIFLARTDRGNILGKDRQEKVNRYRYVNS